MSSYTDARDAYLANADYSETNSAAKASAFVVACRKLILVAPGSSEFADSRTGLETNLQLWHEEQLAAERWLAANGRGASVGGVVHASLTHFRDY